MAKSTTIKKLQENLCHLPPDDLEAVSKFVEFLRASASSKTKERHVNQDWAGAISEYADQFTGLELQKLASSWRHG